ncbi:hypothetical protein C4564_00005 [Candidatus Microgenomates bacterium]|nr:MAG: hypothetical protein C4564_00005 [Candidatus Microgenomates bacterium]
MSDNGLFPKASAFVWPPIWVIILVVIIVDRNLYLQIHSTIVGLQLVNCAILPLILIAAGALYWYGVYSNILNIVLFGLSIVFYATGIGAPIGVAMWGWIAFNLVFSAIAGDSVNPLKLGLIPTAIIQIALLWTIGSLAFCVFGL